MTELAVPRNVAVNATPAEASATASAIEPGPPSSAGSAVRSVTSAVDPGGEQHAQHEQRPEGEVQPGGSSFGTSFESH